MRGDPGQAGPPGPPVSHVDFISLATSLGRNVFISKRKPLNPEII